MTILVLMTIKVFLQSFSVAGAEYRFTAQVCDATEV